MEISKVLTPRAAAATLPPAPDDLVQRGMELFWVQLVFLVLAFIFVCLRAYVRIFLVKKVALEDYLMFFAMALYIAYGVLAMHGVTNGGTGKHVTQFTIPEAVISLRAWYLCEVLYSPITVAIRTSICVFLLRIATNKVHRWILYVNLGVIWIVSIAFFFVMSLQCDPPNYFWEQLLGAKGKCIDINVVPDATIAHSIISALSDWVVGLLPIALLWNVQLNRRTKVTVALLLSMGVIAGVALIVRIPYLRRLAISPDFLYETIDVAIWSVMEPSLGIIAGSAATLRPLFKNWGLAGWSAKLSGRSGGERSARCAKCSQCGCAKTSSSTRGSTSTREKMRSDKVSTGRSGSRITAMGEEMNGSDIELNKKTGSVGHPGSSWVDIERGDSPPLSPNNTPIVHTTIDITSEDSRGLRAPPPRMSNPRAYPASSQSLGRPARTGRGAAGF